MDPTLATNAMAQMAQAKGAVIKRFSPVKAIARDGDAWRVHIESGSIRTKHIVNAAGTWGWEIGAMMGLNIPSVPVLHQYLVTDTVADVAARVAEGLPELPIIRDPDESWYVRQERDGLILGPYEKDSQVWSVDGVPPTFGADLMPPDLDRVEHIIEAAMSRIPALASGGVKSVINGPITFTPDANPLIGPAHGLRDAWLLTGSSMGVMEGGGAGWFLAHWMTHGAPPMDALAVDSRRFGAWADRDYRVAKARALQAERYRDATPPTQRRLNVDASGDAITRHAAPDEAGQALLADAAVKLSLSARSYHRVLKVARTIADLEGSGAVRRVHIAEALSYRRRAPQETRSSAPGALAH